MNLTERTKISIKFTVLTASGICRSREQEYGIVPATLGLEIKKDIPGIEKSARLIRSGSSVKKGERSFSHADLFCRS